MSTTNILLSLFNYLSRFFICFISSFQILFYLSKAHKTAPEAKKQNIIPTILTPLSQAKQNKLTKAIKEIKQKKTKSILRVSNFLIFSWLFSLFSISKLIARYILIFNYNSLFNKKFF